MASAMLLEVLGSQEFPLRVFSTADATDMSLLASGGFGTVHSARLPGLGSETVVLKVAQSGVAYSILAEVTALLELPPKARAQAPKMFGLIEGETGLSVPCWVKDVDGSATYRFVCLEGFVMEELSGDMFDLLPQLSYPGRCAALKQMAESLVVLHDSGVIHCDVKLDNFLVRAYQPPGKSIRFTTKVADFGLCRKASPEGLTWCPLNTGTIGYMAPEMTRKVYPECANPDDGTYASYAPPQAKISTKADVYSFGRLLMLAHKPEREGNFEEALASMRPSPDADSWMELSAWCCQQNPNDRPTMREVLDVIRSLHSRSRQARVPVTDSAAPATPAPSCCSPAPGLPSLAPCQQRAAKSLVAHPLASISGYSACPSQTDDAQAAPCLGQLAGGCSSAGQSVCGCTKNPDVAPTCSMSTSHCSDSMTAEGSSSSATSLCTGRTNSQSSYSSLPYSNSTGTTLSATVNAQRSGGHVRRVLGGAFRMLRRLVRIGA